jgi:hypothetical protein
VEEEASSFPDDSPCNCCYDCCYCYSYSCDKELGRSPDEDERQQREVEEGDDDELGLHRQEDASLDDFQRIFLAEESEEDKTRDHSRELLLDSHQ